MKKEQSKGNLCNCQLPMYEGYHCMRCHKTTRDILPNLTEEDIKQAIEDADND